MKNEAKKFINDVLLEGTAHRMQVCTLINDNGGGMRGKFSRNPDELVAFCEKWDREPNRGVYYCVSTMSEDRRSRANAAEIKFLFADIDHKDVVEEPDVILARVKALPMPPSRIHHSGNGLHLLWVLKQPTTDMPRVTALLKRIARVVAGDPQVCEVARLLRMPGTHNTKGGARKEVTVTKGRKTYHLDDLAKWFETQEPILTRKGAPAPVADNPFAKYGEEQGIKPPIDVDARLAAMTHQGAGETSVHATQLAVTASLLSRGENIDDVVEEVLKATQERIDQPWDWERERERLYGMCEFWLKKLPQQEIREEQHQSPREKIEPVDLWANFEPPTMPRGLLPTAIENYALTMGETMGADPAGLAMAALTVCGAAQVVLIGSPNGVLLYQDELSGFFGSMAKYAGHRGAAKDRAFWLQGWNGGPYGLNRVERGVSIIPNLSISLLGGIQPDVVRKIAAESQDDGFLARMLVIVLRPAVVGRDELAPPVAEEYAKLVTQLAEMSPPDGENAFERNAGIAITLKFDEGAQTLRGELESKHLALAQGFEAINKKLAAAIGKYDGYFGRLCVIFHCIKHADEKPLPDVVTKDTARRVAEFMHQFLLPHAVAFYSGVLGLADQHDRLASVAGHILARQLERVTNRDVQRGDRTMRGLTRRETDEVFEQLEALGWVTRTPGPRQGLHWIVNPEVHVRFSERAAKEAAQRAATRELIASQLRAAAPGS